MGWFSSDSDEAQAHATVTEGHHSSITHEALAGAAAFAAAQAYEKHVAANGKPATHSKAKEILAGFTAAFIDREVESKGLDFIDKEKAKHQAKKQAEAGLANSGDYN